jgi:hypothetical protein
MYPNSEEVYRINKVKFPNPYIIVVLEIFPYKYIVTCLGDWRRRSYW